MKASVVTSFRSPLEVREVPTPSPGPGQILVRIEASGLCHTDVHAARGDWPVRPTLPLIPGHEGVGVVDQLGAEVTAVAVGDRVAIPWLGYACGVCHYCESGRETLCEKQQNTGYALDGAHAEYSLAYARHVVLIPHGLQPVEAAPLTCAGATTYRAVKAAGVRRAERVAVFGIGGLGHLALQYAHLFGGETVAVDVTAGKLALAKRLGALHTVDASQGDPVPRIRALGGVDVAIVVATAPAVPERAYASLRRGGRLVLVSLPKQQVMRLPVFPTILNELTLMGSVAGDRADLADVFALHAAGRTTVEVESRKLDAINLAIDDLLAGKVAGRVVFEL